MKTAPFTILLLFALVSILGIFIVPKLAIKLSPSYVQSTLYVSCSWRNANAQTIEKQVTSVLEGNLNTIKGIASIKSSTSDGRCQITIAFGEHVSMQTAQYEAATLIRNLYPSFPQGVSYPTIGIRGQNAEKRPFMAYSVLSKLPLNEIQSLGTKELIPRLQEMEGVHSAGIYGAQGKKWHVYFDREVLRTLELKESDLRTAIKGQEAWQNLGITQYKDAQSYVVMTSEKAIDWEAIPITSKEGKTIYLGDVARVSLEDNKPSGYYRLNGLNTVSLVITPQDEANQIKLAKKVKAFIQETEEEWQGKATFVLKKDDSQFIAEETEKIVVRSMLTLAILFLFVWLISWNGRYLLIIVLSILANISMAFLAYYFIGIELHIYSFAGITVSMGIIIDNSIVMVDHLRHKNNRRVFLALLAATLTTISSLSIIFFLSERLILNMLDFALVIMVNLSVSLLVALFLVPALMDKFPLRTQLRKRKVRKVKRIIKFSTLYARVLRFMNRFKWAFFILLVLGFGLPVYMLPGHLGERNEKLSFWQEAYNNTIGSDFYKENLRTPIDIGLGGALRLFTEKVNHSRYFQNRERTNLTVTAQMPVGATLTQMNEAYQVIETYLQQFKEIKQFETYIYGLENARLVIDFKDEYEMSSFPFLLQDLIIQKAIDIGSADMQVVGRGDGFNNSLKERTGSYKIEMYGYNYEQLYDYAEELQKKLSNNARVKEVNIMGKNTWYRDNNFSYVLREDDGRISLSKDHFYNIYKELQNYAMDKERVGRISLNGQRHEVIMSSASAKEFNVWDLKNSALQTPYALHKMGFLSNIEKEMVPSVITRVNQQYYLMLEYDFIGPYQLGTMHLDQIMEEFTPKLEVGYSAEKKSRSLKRSEKHEQVYMVLIVILIIYFICAILFESLLQPLAVISVIPITFIGVFLSFYLFELNFDQGGFAAFVLLSGLTVNSALFIINDMNNLRARYTRLDNSIRMKTYVKAFNAKIIPILLATLSTVIGLSPYLYLGQSESFWFPLSVGTSGGLIFSLVAIYLYLPLFFTRKIAVK